MHHAGYGLRRITLPRTPVNRGIRKGREMIPDPLLSTGVKCLGVASAEATSAATAASWSLPPLSRMGLFGPAEFRASRGSAPLPGLSQSRGVFRVVTVVVPPLSVVCAGALHDRAGVGATFARGGRRWRRRRNEKRGQSYHHHDQHRRS